MLSKSIKNLSTSEKIILVQEIWDDIALDLEKAPVSQDEINFIEQRLKYIEETPRDFISWDQLKTRLKRKKK